MIPLVMTLSYIAPFHDNDNDNSNNNKDNIYFDNKANLRDLIAATGLVILLKLDLNRQFFSPCDLEIWRMTRKNNRAPLQCYFKLCASFLSHWWIQTWVTIRKLRSWVKIDDFLSRVTLQFDIWPWTRAVSDCLIRPLPASVNALLVNCA